MDDLLRSKLDATGLPYSVDADGYGELHFSWSSENRSQKAFISGKKDVLGDYEDWDIFSAVAKIPDGGLPGEIATMLLKKSGMLKAGGFVIRGDFLLYKLEVSCDISPKALADAIGLVGQIADDFEKEFTGGGDNF